MVKHNRQNTLLMEILIVVLFFALCSTVILNVFVGAHNQSARAGAQADALIVTALRQEKTLFSLPSARYVPEEVAP